VNEAAVNGTVDESAADGDEEAPTTDRSRWRRYVVIALAVLAAAGGVAGSWAYNSGYRTRAANDSAVIRSAADPSTYVTPGDRTRMTVPIRNDSPYAITVVSLLLPEAPRIVWNYAPTVIQPGTTAYLQVIAPGKCAAVPHPLKHTGPVDVTLRVVTVDGRPHGSLRMAVSGVIEYAADYCAVPTDAASEQS
jgi:hypothetical protein